MGWAVVGRAVSSLAPVTGIVTARRTTVALCEGADDYTAVDVEE